MRRLNTAFRLHVRVVRAVSSVKEKQLWRDGDVYSIEHQGNNRT